MNQKNIETNFEEELPMPLFPTQEELRVIREKYKKCTRVQLLHMEDPFPVPVGCKGTVTHVDDAGDICVSWDNGSSLKVIIGVDKIKILDEGEKTDETN